jgi:hypothetical protein
MDFKGSLSVTGGLNTPAHSEDPPHAKHLGMQEIIRATVNHEKKFLSIAGVQYNSWQPRTSDYDYDHVQLVDSARNVCSSARTFKAPLELDRYASDKFEVGSPLKHAPACPNTNRKQHGFK